LHSHRGLSFKEIDELTPLQRQYELMQHWKESKQGSCLKCFLAAYVKGMQKGVGK